MTLSSESFETTRRLAGDTCLGGAMAREARMVATVATHGIANETDAARVADSIVRDTDRAISGVGQALRNGAAASVTREIKASGLASRHACEPANTGALPRATMRVRGAAPSGVATHGAPSVAADTVLLRAEQAERIACATLRTLIPSLARSHGSIRKDTINQITRIMRDYPESVAVLATARDLGWRV